MSSGHEFSATRLISRDKVAGTPMTEALNLLCYKLAYNFF